MLREAADVVCITNMPIISIIFEDFAVSYVLYETEE